MIFTGETNHPLMTWLEPEPTPQEALFHAIVVRLMKDHGVTREALMGRLREQPLAEIRQIGYWLTREVAGLTLHQTARLWGRDHGTIVAGCHRVDSLIQTDARLRQKIETLQNDLTPKTQRHEHHDRGHL